MTIQNLLLGSTGPGSETSAPPGVEGEVFATALDGAMEALADPPPELGPPGLFLKTGNEEATPKLPNAVGPAPDLLPETPSPMLVAIMPPVRTPEVIPETDPKLLVIDEANDLLAGEPFVGDGDVVEDEPVPDLESQEPLPIWGWPVLPTPASLPLIEATVVADRSAASISPIFEVRADAPVQAIATVAMVSSSSEATSVRDWSRSAPESVQNPGTSMPNGLKVDALRQAIGTQIVSAAVLDFLEPMALQASPAPLGAPHRGSEFPSVIASIPAPRTVAALPTISIEPEVFASVVETPAVADELPSTPVPATAPTVTATSSPAVASAIRVAAPHEDHALATPVEIASVPETETRVPATDVPAEITAPKQAAAPGGMKSIPSDQVPVQVHSRTLSVAEPLVRETGLDDAVQNVTVGPVPTETKADEIAPGANSESVTEVRAASPTPSIDVERVPQRPVGQVRTEEVRTVANQIADRIERLQEGRSPATVTIHLDPQDLGSVTLTVRSLGRLIDADVMASNEAVRAALEQNRPHLAQAVESRGYTVGSLQFTQTHSNTQFSQGQSGHEQATRQDFERMANMARHQDTADRSTPSPTWVVNDQSVDYRI